MTSERGRELLAAYRTDTAPASEDEDALFDAIVRRIVTTDDEELVGAVYGDLDEDSEDSEDFEDFEDFEDAFEDDVTEDEPSANTSPRAARRRARSVVLPVALATAALAAGIVLALSVRGELLSPTSEVSPWQAPNVEEAELPWWRRIVPKRLLDDAELESLPESDAPEAIDAAVVDEAPTVAPKTGPARRNSTPSQRRTLPPRGSAAGPQPEPKSNDGWGAPAYDPRGASVEPSNSPAGAVGGAYPGGGGGTSRPTDKDDSGQRGDGDDKGDSSRPSNPRPSPGGGNGSGSGGGGDDGDPPTPVPPDPPEPPNDPPADDPSEPHVDDCQEEWQGCLENGGGPECDAIHSQCMGEPYHCDIDLDLCIESGEDVHVCQQIHQDCMYGTPAPDQCFEDYQACTFEIPAEFCIEALSMCFQAYGGLPPEQCTEITATCESLGPPLQCDDVAFACESAVDPAMLCEHQMMECMESAPPEAHDMCFGAHDECLAEAYGGPPPEDCHTQFDLCTVEQPHDPDACEAELDACVGG